MAGKSSTDVELEARVRVLEKLVDRLLDKLSEVSVATKTADKALAMAQEALVIITSGKRAQEDENFDSVPAGMNGEVPKGPVLPEGDESNLI